MRGKRKTKRLLLTLIQFQVQKGKEKMEGEMAANEEVEKARRVDLFSLLARAGRKKLFPSRIRGRFWGERKIIYDGSFAV
jgi:hypothetical protein